jgi:hypothetical protein
MAAREDRPVRLGEKCGLRPMPDVGVPSRSATSRKSAPPYCGISTTLSTLADVEVVAMAINAQNRHNPSLGGRLRPNRCPHRLVS